MLSPYSILIVISKIIDKLDIDLIESDLSEIFSVDIFNKKILFNSQIEE